MVARVTWARCLPRLKSPRARRDTRKSGTCPLMRLVGTWDCRRRGKQEAPSMGIDAHSCLAWQNFMRTGILSGNY
jgi:hypothetical protein